MKERIANLWVEALESGEYKQGRGVLKRADGRFCCLGVLCDLYHKETGKGSWSAEPTTAGGSEPGTFIRAFRFDAWRSSDCEWLPEPVRKWAGMRYSSGDFILSDTREDRAISKRLKHSCLKTELTELNDRRLSFKTIAKVIRRHKGDL